MTPRSLTNAVTGLLAAAALTLAPMAASAQDQGDRRGWGRPAPDGWARDDRRGGRDGYHDGYRDGRDRGPDYRDRDGYRAGRDEDRRSPGFDRGGPRRGGPGRYARGRDDRRQRCRDDGAGGTILGAIAGGLLGNSIAGSGDRTVGTLLGGGAGALAGRAIDRDC